MSTLASQMKAHLSINITSKWYALLNQPLNRGSTLFYDGAGGSLIT